MMSYGLNNNHKLNYTRIKMNIYYDKSLKRDLMKSHNLDIDESNYIIDKKSRKRILDINKEYIKANQFGGFKKGSIQYLTENIQTILQEAGQKSKTAQ
jgi:hypothetical protein